ncbi:MAG: hypothetical protein WBB22_17035, partial [Anaerolineae bacterium]
MRYREEGRLRTWSTLQAVTADHLIERRPFFGRAFWALVDSGVHGLVAVLVTAPIIRSAPTARQLAVLAFLAGTLVDVDHFLVAGSRVSFRAEEFAHPHFDEALQSNQIPANAAMLEAILASQDRKVLLVESVERLLEKSTRDAFTDLLTLVARDKSWRLVLTCRDYSAELVRACFLESASVSHSVVTVPSLDDEESEEVKAVHPTLARPHHLARHVHLPCLRHVPGQPRPQERQPQQRGQAIWQAALKGSTCSGAD